MKKTILWVILAMAMCSFAFATDPTCTVTLPASSTAYSGTQTFAVAITSNGTGVFNITGVNFTISSSVVASNVSGGINKSNYYVAGVDTTGITDTTGTTVTANIIVNGTGYLGSCTSTGVKFDNSNPVCSCNLAKTKISLMQSIEYDCSASTDAITAITYSCVSTYADGTTETETDEKGVFETTTALGEASVVCTITDAKAHTNACSAISFTIEGDGDTDGTPSTPTGGGMNNQTALFIFLGGISVVIMVVVIVSLAQKGKKRRR